ncbi:DUF5694 domain-containing protein [Stenotrophomonas sp. OVS01A]|uniref:DUF5694 domain-containing protein n=1 Tax=Stenotrophomonas sp. OVS01A TaxID=2862680 RepID=UPI001CBFF49E|nr:DUF5694 domain-containing protein [Stenotrophomonas sp. OVS01A]
MLRRLNAIIFLSLCSAGALASDAGFRPSFHPDQLKGPPAGRHNEVLVLGTAHLSELPKTFEPAMLEPLLQRLARWRPEAIATENLSGLQCDFMRRNPSRYAESVETYCFDTDAARVATGFDVPSANAEMGRLLSAWPASPTAAQRRHLAAVFLAAGERGSAQVQWLRLPVQDRIAGDGLDAALVGILDKSLTRRNETNLVAAVLAARLGLERLWAVDDHTADSPTPPEDKKAAREAMMKAWDNPHANARLDADEPLYANVGKVGGVLDLYRAYNRPGVGLQAYQADFGAALVEPSPQGFGRNYVGYWETRNLRMVANIREVLGQRPGTRLLAIVGASHKGYYEAYLNMMHDVQLVDAEEVLR